MGERGGEEIGTGKHRLALREMRHRPGNRFRRRIAIVCGAVRTSGIRARRNRCFRPNRPFRCQYGGAYRRPDAHRGYLPDQRAGIEPDIGGLFLPGVPQFLAVDVALGGARQLREPAQRIADKIDELMDAKTVSTQRKI